MAPTALVAISTACTVSRSLYDFIRSARKVDTTIELLYTAVLRLEASLKNVDTTLNSPGVIEATKDHSLYAGSLNAINSSLQDCEHTLRAFSDILPKTIATQNLNIFKKAKSQFKLTLSRTQMDSLRYNIQDHSTSLQIAMHTLTLDIACRSSQGLRDDLAIGIDTIADIMTTINPHDQVIANKELPSSFVNAALPEHTSSMVATAHKVMSTTRSALSEASRSSSVSTFRRKLVPGIEAAHSEVGAPMATKDRDRIMNWMSPQDSNNNSWSSTIPSDRTEKLSTIDSSRVMNGTPLRHFKSNSRRSTVLSDAVMTPFTSVHEGSLESGEERDGTDEEVDDLEVELVGVMIKTGSDHMTKSSFADAEGNFSRAIERFNLMTGRTRRYFDCNEQRLWLAYSKLYQGKTQLLLPELESLHQSSSNRLFAIRALYAVAHIHVCDFRNSNHQLAERTCRQVINDLRRHFGKDSIHHQIHHRSLNLLVAICSIRGDSITAAAYLKLIPPSSEAKKDGVMDDLPELSIDQIRRLTFRAQAGDEISLRILFYPSDAGTLYPSFEYIVSDRSWPPEVAARFPVLTRDGQYEKLFDMYVGEQILIGYFGNHSYYMILESVVGM